MLCSAAPAHAALRLEEIRTASNNVLVAYFKSTTINANEVNTADLSSWKLNGQPVTAINRFVTEADACDHHIYLEVPALINGTRYTLQTPHGDTDLRVRRPSGSSASPSRPIRPRIVPSPRSDTPTSPSGLGDGGARPISGRLPAYSVFRLPSGETIAHGTVKEIGKDSSSGDFVYRIDLSAVPEGGPYKIAVNGYGCSYPFGVGGDFSRRLAPCLLPFALSPALRLPDQGTLCMGHQDEPMPHDDLQDESAHW